MIAAYERIAAALRLRERLRPYIHEQMRVASRTGLPPMRPLFVDFPADPGAWDVEDEFMFGPDLLIAPVLEPGARDPRRLPARRPPPGSTRQRGSGTKAGPLARVPLSPDRIPVFVREEAEVLDVVR